MIRRLLEAGPVGEEELDMIKMFCYNSAAEFCNRPYIADKTIINKSIKNHKRHGRRVVYITIKYLSPDYNMISRLMALNKKSRAEWR